MDPSTDFQSCLASYVAVGFNFCDAGINSIPLQSNEVTITISTSNKEDHFRRQESSYWVYSHMYLLGSIFLFCFVFVLSLSLFWFKGIYNIFLSHNEHPYGRNKTHIISLRGTNLCTSFQWTVSFSVSYPPPFFFCFLFIKQGLQQRWTSLWSFWPPS